MLLTAYGLWSRHLFSQALWTATGQQRMLGLAAVYAAWSALTIAFARRWFVLATSILLALGLAAAIGFPAVAAVALSLISSWKLGALLRCEAEAPTLADGILQTLLGVSVWMTALSIAVHFRMNYGPVHVCLFLAPLLVKPRRTAGLARDAWRAIRSFPSQSLGESLALSLAVFPLLCHLVLIPKPEVGADALAMHLMAPAWVAYQHLWPFDVSHFVWAVMPMGADWCFTGVYLLGGEFAARLLNFALLALTAALVYAASRPYAGRCAALLFAGLFASTPLVQLVTGSLMVENLQAAYLAGAVFVAARFWEEAKWRDLYTAAALAGAALATKFGSSALAVPLLIFLVWAAWKNRERLPRAGRHVAAAVGVALAIGALPYLVAYATTGNPFFPYMNDVFRSRWFEAKAVLDTRFVRPLGFRTPFEAVFHSRDYLEGRDGAAGLQFFILIFLGAALWRRRWPALGTLALAGAVLHCVLTFRTLAYLRYVYAALPLLSIAGAVAVGRLRGAQRWLFRAALLIVAAVLLLNLYFLPASGWWHPDFYLNPFDHAEVTKYVTESAPARLLVDQLNRAHPGEAVAFFGTETIAGLRAESYSFGWHNHAYERQVMELTGPIGYGQLARRIGVRWFVAPADWSRAGASGIVSNFLARYTVPASTAGPYELRGWRPGAAGELAQAVPERPLKACDPALIDDQSTRLQYRGRWRTLREFGMACGGTLSYTDEPGAEVTLAFSGTSVTYVFTRAYTRGRAEVLIDGIRREVLDEFSSGIEWRSEVTYAGLAPGPHTITIRCLHSKAAASTDYDVDADGFLVR
ncbi:MAG: glycosyltransferase family 39 protein [Bryobacteraceae bacterium]|nr:glycosyltransferase family 39 protein [Bryobacteraceae bacterium]